MKKHLLNRVVALVLAAVMVLGQIPAVSAAQPKLTWKESDVEVSLNHDDRLVPDTIHEMADYKPTDSVRVSIILEKASTVGAGYSTMDVAGNASAMAYDRNLLQVQKEMEKTISAQALGGKALDVVWNLTLVTNIISANVPYGKIEAIKAIDGVKDVVIEVQYETTENETVSPNMYTSSGMIGSNSVWASGMTGAGSRVAIIDTGTDTDHQSFANNAYLYALEQNAAAKGMSYEEYVASLDLLDVDEIAAVLDKLNAFEKTGSDNAADYFISEKLPFGVNYVDENLNVTHDYDEQGSHGSHVAGIAAANRYVELDGVMTDARTSVFMNGVAPDAQILTMKVFGANGGAYDSDYFAAIEDAILLGCDSVNLSLGSGNPGTSENTTFAELLDFLATTDTVVVMSAGNSGYWAENAAVPYLYGDGVSFHTGGSPGSYTNSLAVASVDNDGTVGKFFGLPNESVFVYSESTDYGNAPLASLDTSADGTGTTYEYVFVDGIGVAEDYEGIDLTGKIVFCSRGETSFFEKANLAVSLGAVATIIYNNQPGTIGLNLTGYEYSAPCVSITQSDGSHIRSASMDMTTEAGLEYRVGWLTVYSQNSVADFNSDYYTMSSFSSWGVPGSLELKPEITAPGGGIWSVNGVDPSGTAYELMSGTSMAAPQVTGMVALVAEYIKQGGLDEQTGMSVRHLAQSLLMSTAVPVLEGANNGDYYSLLNQGAGLARVDLATRAESYVLVDGQDDGKVKVELGEDADREGVYAFSFSINNMNGQDMAYELWADGFTQAMFDGGNGILYLDTWTTHLGLDASFSADGVSLEAMPQEPAYDLDGDGVANAEDADYLLEYLLGNESELHGSGDIDGDGDVDTYDAHVLLTKQTGAYMVNVPANGSVTIDVVLELNDYAREYLDTYYTTGAYVESFVYAAPVTDSEGVQGVTHSIPVLGYYGSWTESSMYDIGSYLEYAYGLEYRAPYLYNTEGILNNFMTIDYGNGDEYIFGGNPIVDDETYLPARNAFNNESGAYMKALYFGLIRNAANSMLLIEDAATGAALAAYELGPINGAYYYVNGQSWENTQQKLGLGLNFAGIPEGTRLNVSLVAAPEYYCTYNADGSVTTDWNALEDGAYLTTSFTIDNTAPELVSFELGENNTLMVTAKDNEYIAAVALANASGSTLLSSAAVNQTERGVEMTAAVDVSAVFGEQFLIAVYDYAENVSVYEVTLELENERPYFTAVDVFGDMGGFVGMNADGSAIALTAAAETSVAAAEYVEGYVFSVDDNNDLYVTADDDLYTTLYLGNLDPNFEWGMFFNDLAYNKADGKLYGNFYSLNNWMEAPYLCTIDMFTGEMEVLGEMPVDAQNMAIDGEGNFYSTIYGYSDLVTYTADAVETGVYTQLGQLAGYATEFYASMAWDHNANALYWAYGDGETTSLLKIDPATAAVEMVNQYPFCATGLYIAYEPENDLFAPTDVVASVAVTESADTLVNNFVQLEAKVMPWNVSDDSVTWTSDNEDVAVVDENGTVYGVSAGTATITATSNLDATKSASCTVTVTELSKDLKGLVWDENGQVHWASFNTSTLPAYESLSALNPNLPVNATMVVGDTLYASTLDTSSGLSDLYTVNPETFEMTPVGPSRIAYLDMAFGPGTGYGFATYFNYIVFVDLATGDYVGAWDWSAGMTADLVGITYYGSQYNENYGAWMDFFLILDAEGNVYLEAFLITPDVGGYFMGPADGFITTIGDPVDYSYFQGFHFDGEYVYWTRFNEADNVVELVVWDSEDTGNVYSMGYFADGVWPVAGLYTDAELAGTNALAHEKMANATIKSAELLSEVPTVELKTSKTVGGLNAVNGTIPAVQPMSKGDVAANGDTDVSVTVPEAATNGMMTVTYDAAALELLNAAGKTDAFAWKAVEDGKILIAFADSEAVDADAVVAMLNFDADAEGDSTITIAYSELNDAASDTSEDVTVTLPANRTDFEDLDPEATWYLDAVDWAVDEGVTDGVNPEGTLFAPGRECTRGEIVTMLWRAAGEPEPTITEHSFTDVVEGEYYYEAMLWAVENGITNGIGNNHFAPTKTCSRAEAVTLLWRAKGEPAPTSTEHDFTDVTEDYYTEAMLWAVENGITTGVNLAKTLFAPTRICTRAEIVTFLYRAFAD